MIMSKILFSELTPSNVILGEGAFGVVSKYILNRTNKAYAGKTLGTLTDFKMELEILLQVGQHPFICSLFAYTDDNECRVLLFDMALCDLREFTRTHLFTERQLTRLWLHGLSAVKHLNKHQILHRDIKPSNILVTFDGYIKLADFGISSMMNRYQEAENTGGGTKNYKHIDVRSQGKENAKLNITFVTDLWSLAVTIAKLATGKFPFKSTEDMKQLKGEKAFGHYKTDFATGLSGEFAFFIYFIVSRPTADSHHYTKRPTELFRGGVFKKIDVNLEKKARGRPLFNMRGEIAKVLKARDERQSQQIMNRQNIF